MNYKEMTEKYGNNWVLEFRNKFDLSVVQAKNGLRVIEIGRNSEEFALIGGRRLEKLCDLTKYVIGLNKDVVI